MLRLAVFATLPAILIAATPALGASGHDTPYYQGKTRLGLGGGGYSNGGFIDVFVAASFGVFVVDNLELGVDAAIHFGDDDPVAQLGPQLRYILPIDKRIHPYLGAFYRHWFGPAALAYADSAGGRAGVLLRTGHVYLAAGVAFEAALSDCAGDGCSEWYPEFGASLLF
ncbi:MAG: hypothetical protein CSA66_07030 [Proteobacteria bacterium]|nr:MAG: hypothetical protein CSA66_07030 [Pseudomonadota bacterium]